MTHYATRRRSVVVGLLLGAALLAPLGAAAPLSAASPASGTSPRLTVAVSAPEAVFRWRIQRCDDLMIPDSPARALRGSDGSVTLLAAHYTNVPLRGRDFDSLAPVCPAASRGAESDDPASFDDRFWIQAIAPLGNGRVLGLASHEYMGARHPGRCEVPTRGQRSDSFRCWYSAITATVADERDWRFQPLPVGRRVVAASPRSYDPAGGPRTGFFSVSNVVFDAGFAYALVYVEGVPGQPSGNCLLRAPRADLLDGWRAMSGGRFTADYRVPPGREQAGARPQPACDVVGAGVFTGPARSVIRVGGAWVAAFTGRARDAASGAERSGVFTSVSADLRAWSPPTLLWEMAPFHGQPEAGVYYAYPSLIDHASPSPLFDTAGTSAWLYLTRFNLENRRDGMNRDLVRLRVEIAP